MLYSASFVFLNSCIFCLQFKEKTHFSSLIISCCFVLCTVAIVGLTGNLSCSSYILCDVPWLCSISYDSNLETDFMSDVSCWSCEHFHGLKEVNINLWSSPSSMLNPSTSMSRGLRSWPWEKSNSYKKHSQPVSANKKSIKERMGKSILSTQLPIISAIKARWHFRTQSRRLQSLFETVKMVKQHGEMLQCLMEWHEASSPEITYCSFNCPQNVLHLPTSSHPSKFNQISVGPPLVSPVFVINLQQWASPETLTGEMKW